MVHLEDQIRSFGLCRAAVDVQEEGLNGHHSLGGEVGAWNKKWPQENWTEKNLVQGCIVDFQIANR
jgi:hypothetical protein